MYSHCLGIYVYSGSLCSRLRKPSLRAADVSLYMCTYNGSLRIRSRLRIFLGEIERREVYLHSQRWARHGGFFKARHAPPCAALYTHIALLRLLVKRCIRLALPSVVRDIVQARIYICIRTARRSTCTHRFCLYDTAVRKRQCAPPRPRAQLRMYCTVQAVAAIIYKQQEKTKKTEAKRAQSSSSAFFAAASTVPTLSPNSSVRMLAIIYYRVKRTQQS